jgi:cyanophycin synthetase
VVLNVSADHLGLGGIHTVEQLAEVKSVVAAIVKREGHAVLNADDPLVYAMRERTTGDVVLFSTLAPGENAAFEAHLASGGIGARIEDGMFVVRRGRLRIPIAAVHEVPLMLGGAARFQEGNILAAIATAYVQGVRYDTIRAGLLSFFPSPSTTPGRLNLMRVGSVRVLIDYAHNPAAIEGLLDLVQRMPARRRTLVLAVPGDRRDEDIREAGRLAACVDRVIVKEDEDLRGRRPGEVAGLLMDSLRRNGLSEGQITHVPDESDAIAEALEGTGEGDLIVVLAEDVGGVLKFVHLRQQVTTGTA